MLGFIARQYIYSAQRNSRANARRREQARRDGTDFWSQVRAASNARAARKAEAAWQLVSVPCDFCHGLGRYTNPASKAMHPRVYRCEQCGGNGRVARPTVEKSPGSLCPCSPPCGSRFCTHTAPRQQSPYLPSPVDAWLAERQQQQQQPSGVTLASRRVDQQATLSDLQALQVDAAKLVVRAAAEHTPAEDAAIRHEAYALQARIRAAR